MPFNPLEEARSHIGAAKYQAEAAAALLAGVSKPDIEDLRSTHVAILDAEVACADAHAKVASLAQVALGEPGWQRMVTDARQARQTAAQVVQDDLETATGEGRR